MLHPDQRFHNPSPEYIQGLISNIGMSLRDLQQLTGVSKSALSRYTIDPLCPYSVQYMLEIIQDL